LLIANATALHSVIPKTYYILGQYLTINLRGKLAKQIQDLDQQVFPLSQYQSGKKYLSINEEKKKKKNEYMTYVSNNTSFHINIRKDKF
jgi:hypothetical protein